MNTDLRGLTGLTRRQLWNCFQLRAYSHQQKATAKAKKFKEQESPPAWTQEAYRPPCSEYSFCCPTWVPPQPGYSPPSWPGQGGVPDQGTPLARVPPGQSTPPARVPPSCPMAFWEMLQSIMGYGYPHWLPMAFWEMLQSIMGYGYPHWLPHGILGNVAKNYGIWVPPCGQTNKVKVLLSRRTTYAGGNNKNRSKTKW